MKLKLTVVFCDDVYCSSSEVASRVLSLAVDNCISAGQTLQPPVRITLQQRQVVHTSADVSIRDVDKDLSPKAKAMGPRTTVSSLRTTNDHATANIPVYW